MSRPDITAYIHGNSRGLQDALARVRTDARRTSRETQADFAMMSARLRGEAATLTRSLAGMFAGGIFAGGTVGFSRGVRQIVAERAEIGQVAERIGLTTDALQELRYGFEQVGISATSFDGNMERFGRRIGTAATAGGRLADILAANGVAIRDANGAIRDSQSLLRDYAELIRNAGSEQERLMLAQEAFGQGGRAMVDALKGGASAIDGMSDAAQDAGVVIRQELIERAAELDQQWSQAWTKFSTYAKAAVLEALGPLQQLDDVAQSILRNLPVARLGEWLAGGGDAGSGELPIEEGLRRLEDRRAMLQEHIGRFREGTDAYREAASALRAVDEQIAQLNSRMGPNASGAAPGGKPVDIGQVTIVPDGKDGNGGGRASGRDRAAEAALREAQTVANLIDNLAHELSLIGASDLEKARANAMRQAGAAATDDERRQIDMLVTAIHEETEALRRNEQAQTARERAMESLFQMGNDAITAMIDNSLSAEDAIKRMAVQLAFAAAQAALLNTGPLAGLFGGGGSGGGGGGLPFFGGARARGGDVSPGRIYQINEKEYFAPGAAGRIVPPGGQGGGVTIAPVFQIDAKGADAGVEQRLENSLRKFQREFEGNVVSALRSINMKGVEI